MKVKPVIKYPGAKWRIAKDIVNLIPIHHSYVEPYFGSGAVLFNKRPSNIETINDMDGRVVNLFKCLQNDPQKLARLVDTTPFARDCYNESFNHDESDPFISALLFIVSCCQGHGFRATGKRVGWKNDVQGRERAYALRNWCDLPNVIMETAERLKLVQIDNRPALEVIRRFDYENVFMYLDPPYLRETRNSCCAQYKHEMTYDDHVELLNNICKSKAKIMISGYASELYDNLLSNWERVELKSNDNTGRRTTEVVWMNYKEVENV